MKLKSKILISVFGVRCSVFGDLGNLRRFGNGD